MPVSISTSGVCSASHGGSASRSNTAAPNDRRSQQPLDSARDEVAVLAVLRAAGALYHRVVFTRNRRTMASVGRGGTLRLHSVFAAAPEEVLRAVAICLTARTRLQRARARRVLCDFFAQAQTPAVTGPRLRQHDPEHFPHIARLQEEFARVNFEFFAGTLPAVPLFLSDRMRRRNGHFVSDPPQIVIAARLCTHALPGEAEQTLRHEMIHLWQHAQGSRPDHGRDFRQWAIRLGVRPRATRAVCWR